MLIYTLGLCQRKHGGSLALMSASSAPPLARRMHLLSHPRRGAARDPDLQPAPGAHGPQDLAILAAGLRRPPRGRSSIGRLSELLATDRTTLTRNLRPLLEDGLIERTASGDRRRRELVATPAGRALFKRALPLWAAAEQEVRDGDGHEAHRRPARRARPFDGQARGTSTLSSERSEESITSKQLDGRFNSLRSGRRLRRRASKKPYSSSMARR